MDELMGLKMLNDYKTDLLEYIGKKYNIDITAESYSFMDDKLTKYEKQLNGSNVVHVDFCFKEIGR